MKKRSERKFYTLIEIMTVIVIAALLFGIGIPAFTTMIQGSNMTVAIRQLSAKISAARAYAVSNRCNVAVLLMETGIKEEYCYSAYRVCVVDSSNAFQEWIEDENWKTLPKGVLRNSVTNTTSVTANALDIGGTNSTNCPALIFNSKGQLSNSSVITLRQGRYLSSATPATIWTERSGDGKIISHPLGINQYSGKITVQNITETTPDS